MPFLEDKNIRRHVHAAVAQISLELGCPVMRVGGVSDHVHVLADLGRNMAPADWIKEMKRKSSLLVKAQYPSLPHFGWQAGYGVFSVHREGLERLGRYIDDQERHHQEFSFQDEFRAILVEHGVAFDERYVWS
jgi:REP element-mobilizing transposase RayT